jgi:hypothetical protein
VCSSAIIKKKRKEGSIMKKIIFFSVLLCLLVAPVWGAVVIKVVQGSDPNEYKVIYDVNGEPNRIRAFGLDVNVTGSATIYDANWLKWNSKYQIYPGSIDINDSGIVQDYGSPICDPCGMPAGTTLPGLDSNGVTIEMGSLYVGAPNAPPSTGTLLSLYITGQPTIIIKGNAARVGPNSPPTPSYSPGLVMEDPDQHPAVLFKGYIGGITISGRVVGNLAPKSTTGIGGVTMTLSTGGSASTATDGTYSTTVASGWSGTITPSKTQWTFAPVSITYSNVTSNQTGQNYTGTASECLANTDPGYTAWSTTWGKPNCWCYKKQCRGDLNGTSAFGKPVSSTDLDLFKLAYNKSDAELALVTNGICADLNHTSAFGKRVSSTDLDTFKLYYNLAEASVPECASTNINFWTN